MMGKYKKKLTDLCAIQYGCAFDSGKFTDDEKYPPLIRIRDVKRGYSETFYCGDFQEEYIIHEGDVLIGMDGEFNIAKWKSRDALLNQRVCKIVAKKNINGEYLRYYLSCVLKKLRIEHLSLQLNIYQQEN